MGRQVNFYMMPDDLADFESALKAQGNVVFLAIPMPGPGLREEEGLGPLPGDYGCRYLTRREDRGRVQTVHVPTTGKLMIKAPESPVVEFSRCRFDETGALRCGRLYVTTPRRGGLGFDAGPEFLAWADSLLAWIRKNKSYTVLKEPQYKGIYLSKRAAEWRGRGGVLGAS